MALIKCPECGEMVSDKAISCIKCGYPIRDFSLRDSDKGFSTAEDGLLYAKGQENVNNEPSQQKTLPIETLLEYLKHAISLEGIALGEQEIIDDYKSTSEKNKPQLVVAQNPSAPVAKPIPVIKGNYPPMGLAIFGFIAAAIFLIIFISEIPGGMTYSDGSSKASVLCINFIAAAVFAGIGLVVTASNMKAKKRVEDIKNIIRMKI